jgi:hypothetical protein
MGDYAPLEAKLAGMQSASKLAMQQAPMVEMKPWRSLPD